MADNSSIILGALGGASAGAKIGSMIPLPGVGTVVGALGGALLGGIGGSKKQKAVDDAMAAIEAIPAVDPNMVGFRDQLAREKRSVESGFNTEFQVARDLIGQSEAGGMTVAAEIAQTNPALALMMMSQVGNQADIAANKALGTIGTKSMGYTQMLGDLIEKMSQRELDVNMMKAEYGMAQAQANKKDFNANAMALIAKYGPGVLDKLGKQSNVNNSILPTDTINLVDSNLPIQSNSNIENYG